MRFSFRGITTGRRKKKNWSRNFLVGKNHFGYCSFVNYGWALNDLKSNGVNQGEGPSSGVGEQNNKWPTK
jgi:hypothetical protein